MTRKGWRENHEMRMKVCNALRLYPEMMLCNYHFFPVRSGKWRRGKFESIRHKDDALIIGEEGGTAACCGAVIRQVVLEKGCAAWL